MDQRPHPASSSTSANPPAPPPVSHDNLHAPMQASSKAVLARPLTGSTVPRRRRLVPRAGSPAYWAHCLIVVHPSVHDTSMGTTASCHSDPKAERCSQSTAKLNPLPRGMGSEPPVEVSYPLIRASIQGEKPWELHPFVAAKESPTQAPSSCTRTPLSARYTVAVATPVSRRATKTSFT